MRISEVAKAAGVGVETVRFYERKGMIAQPARPARGGFRDYAPAIADRILFIKQAQELGFSLKEADELLSLRADPATDCANIRHRAQRKLSEVDRKMERLGTIRTALRNLVDVCPGKGPAAKHCTILDAIDGGRLENHPHARIETA